ncbi:MAG: riboflavin biosynthesis protein RibF [Desulfovibrionaceae bacterium]|nr:riboflavin biosynthesis protein RibF [Desulfovibrionaceae bacterium]
MFVAPSPQLLLAALDAPHSPLAGKQACITIGNFDGVHAGHRALMQRVHYKAAAMGCYSLVVTFWPHPLVVLRGQGPDLLVGRDEKMALLRGCAVQAVLELPFTHVLSAMSPREFICGLLMPLRLHHLVIGYDFCLGRNKEGNAAVLKALGQELGFSVEALPAIKEQGAIVSSTRLRRCLSHGEVHENMPGMHGHLHSLKGRVLHVSANVQGLPSACIEPDDVLLPSPGVYATWAHCGDTLLPALTYIHTAEGCRRPAVQAVLLDAEAHMPDDMLNIHFVQNLFSASPSSNNIAWHISTARALLAEKRKEAL